MAQLSQHKTTKKIGVLNLQGAVSEHLNALNHLVNVQAIAVKDAAQLANLAGLVIPGGESTAISRLIKQNNLAPAIKQMAQQGKGIFGTCAGLVLCGSSTPEHEVEQLQLIDISVERNGFGRQINSFETALDISAIGKQIPAIFIRAPYIIQAGDQVKQLAFIDNHGVMAQQANVLVCSFHPELTPDNRIIQYFVDCCCG
ncbi:glutamine amidotransferase subunit PdxT [Gilliamella sp. wkB178]|uniref:pyridoxal 5'-phosphate synthase glutaminase subunit PdxT n=1 Tax=Gilliamella sp. wkB178 TaxID=3120259 RepID=UPI00080E913C|nr:pyridoxal 5'-phosphate synthase glutaminase subunit PdxT [Gilliamella apicola]OCG08972.1 glutamine amidotransferase subunit PdxT [Gilliamella apicola]